jgi:hypothetical protein
MQTHARAGWWTTHEEYMKVLASTGRVTAAGGRRSAATMQRPMRTMMISVADAAAAAVDGEDVGVLRAKNTTTSAVL